MENKRVSLKEAAKILGVAPQKLRIQLQRGTGVFSKIGYAERVGLKYSYYIYTDKIAAVMAAE